MVPLHIGKEGSSNTLFQKNPFQQGILVPQHEAFIRCRAVSRIEICQSLLMHSDGVFKLLDVLCSALSKGSLCLPVALLSLLRGSVDLLLVSPHGLHQQECARIPSQ